MYTIKNDKNIKLVIYHNKSFIFCRSQLVPLCWSQYVPLSLCCCFLFPGKYNRYQKNYENSARKFHDPELDFKSGGFDFRSGGFDFRSNSFNLRSSDFKKQNTQFISLFNDFFNFLSSDLTCFVELPTNRKEKTWNEKT